MSELRDDLLTGTRVIVAPARSRRPVTVASAPAGPASEPSGTAALPAFVTDCPFCPGNEGETPPEIARLGPGEPDTPGWRVRVFPNKYPLVGTRDLAGAHEVVITATAHNRSLADLNDDEARKLIAVWRDRVGRQLADGHVHSHAFVNQGKGSGASIEHPHAQVMALDFVPPFVAGMLDRFAAAGRDLVHDALEDARGSNCMIVDDALTASWCPPASSASYAARFASPTGGPRFDRATDDELGPLVLAMRDHLRALRTLLGDVPYNLVVNTAPAHDRPFHWWVDVFPRLTVPGGFEAATGLAVCTTEPADAAAAFRGEDPA